MILTKQLSGTMVWANPRGVWAILPKKRLTTRYNTAKLSQLRQNMEAPLHRDTARKKEKKREKIMNGPASHVAGCTTQLQGWLELRSFRKMANSPRYAVRSKGRP